MSTTYHISTSIRGMLNWTPVESKRNLKWINKDDGTPFGSVRELRNSLMDELANGNELIPAVGCDNFDPKKGCLGHPTKESA